jgi:single-stranded-DNA-specific exonuclease
LSHFRWNVMPPVNERQLARAPDLPPLIVQLLQNRGLTELADLNLFLEAGLPLDTDPFRLPDMHQAVTRIYRALLSGEKIIVYGDFDVDGITSTALLVEGITALGGQPEPYIPHRLTEGYGLKSAAIESLHKQGAGLIVTCDCGVTAVAEVKKARKLGMDIVITDHHTPLEELPPAVAVVDPKRSDSLYPFSQLAGVGVALKLVQALFRGLAKDYQELDNLFDLVALGTVADIVPLLGENRYLVKRGLQTLNNTTRLGIKELMMQAGLIAGGINSERISWVIAPRLNTPGRLEDAMASYQLLTTNSPEKAKELSVWLERKNIERQKMTQDALSLAREQVSKEELTPILFVSAEEFPAGVNGLVAGRLAEEYYRPAVVVRVGEFSSTGSCRSIPEFNVISALNQCRGLLSHYGGHAQAAGFTLPTRNLWQLKQDLLKLAGVELAGVELKPHIDIDMQVSLAEIAGNKTYDLIQKLAPFGAGNPAPIFISRGVTVLDCRTMGNNGEHLRLKIKQGNCLWNGVAFGLGNYVGEVASGMDVVYNLEIDRWNGNETLRLNILDFGKVTNKK